MEKLPKKYVRLRPMISLISRMRKNTYSEDWVENGRKKKKQRISPSGNSSLMVINGSNDTKVGDRSKKMKKDSPVNIGVDLLKDQKLLRKRPRVELGKLDISEGPINAMRLDGKKPKPSETDVPKPEKKTPVKINVEHLKDRKLLRMKPRVELTKLDIRKSPVNVLKLDGKKTLTERNLLKT